MRDISYPKPRSSISFILPIFVIMFSEYHQTYLPKSNSTTYLNQAAYNHMSGEANKENINPFNSKASNNKQQHYNPDNYSNPLKEINYN